VQATLRISRSDVALTTDGAAEVSQRPRGLHAPTIEAVRNLRREWRRTQGLREAGPDRSDHALAEAGRRLSQDFLAGEVGKALAEAVAAAAGGNEVVELGLDIDPELADLPWEALQLPGSDGEIPEVAASPLALHRSVALFRRASNLGPTPAYKIRGPLRILVAIASPEKQNEAGELLDYEAELARIVAAVDPARRKGQASAAVLLAVDADPSDTWPSLRSFARDVGTAGHDFGKDDGKVDAAFGINELDTTVMLNASGKVVSRTIGALDDAGLRAALAKAGVGR